MKPIKSKRVLALGLATICISGLLCACAPQAKAPAESNADDARADEPVAVQVDWSMDSDCASCHGDEASTAEDSACPAFIHAGQNLSCVDCHSDEAALTAAHANADAADGTPSKLGETEVSAAVCESCHNPEELAATTADSTMLTDMNGTVVNPHDLPESGDHSDIQCSDCHKMHSDRGIERTATAECSSCHHAGVYECYTCHE